MISVLKWDSKFFNLKIGTIEIDKPGISELEEIEKQKKDNQFDLLYLFFNEANNTVLEWLEQRGVKLIDQKLTFFKNIDHLLVQNTCCIEKFVGAVTPRLLALAIESGHKSRFNKDARLNARFFDFYQLWIENSVKREMADEVLVSKHNGEISGFVTLKKNNGIGSIGLIAVDENYRGMGIGKDLLTAADNWYIANNCTAASVITQADNAEACRLYTKGGYSILHSQYIFHY